MMMVQMCIRDRTAGGPHAVHLQKQLHAGILQHGLVDDVAEVVGRGIHRAEVEYDELLGAGVIHHKMCIRDSLTAAGGHIGAAHQPGGQAKGCLLYTSRCV